MEWHNVIREHNLETGEIVDRDLTAEELAEREAQAAAEASAATVAESAEAKKAAILAALAAAAGLDPDDVAQALGV